MNGEGGLETAGAAEARSRSGRKGFWLAVILLALVTRAVYGRVMQYGFVELDDYQYILENPHVRGGLTAANIVWAWTHAYASNWHPLTWMSHILDWELWGRGPAGTDVAACCCTTQTRFCCFSFSIV